MQKGEYLLTESIDVIVFGSKASHFFNIIMENQSNTQLSHHQDNKSYIDYLKRVLKHAFNFRINSIKYPAALSLGNMTKITKTIITKTFWFTINFHYPNSQIYDPLLSELIRGPCNIGIMLMQQNEAESEQIKKLFNNEYEVSRYQCKQIINSSKTEGNYEIKILSCLHNPKLCNIDALLNLKIENDKVVVITTKQVWNVNKIIRWIVQNHFQINYSVKLNKNIGDEIQIKKEVEINSCVIC